MAQTAVFLMNLGGPRSLAEVEPYLYELFSDPLLITAPFGPFRPLLARLISKLRAGSSAEKYALIGGKRPLVEGTEAQARALEAALGPGYSCHLAMRCGHPSTAEGVREALASGAERAVALPLYPQWANATTLSSLLELRRRWPGERPLSEIRSWHDHDGYLEASAAALREVLAGVPAALAAAWGLPWQAPPAQSPACGRIPDTAPAVRSGGLPPKIADRIHKRRRRAWQFVKVGRRGSN